MRILAVEYILYYTITKLVNLERGLFLGERYVEAKCITKSCQMKHE